MNEYQWNDRQSAGSRNVSDFEQILQRMFMVLYYLRHDDKRWYNQSLIWLEQAIEPAPEICLRVRQMLENLIDDGLSNYFSFVINDMLEALTPKEKSDEAV